MRRPQFSVRTLLWLVVVGAAFFAGRENGWNAHSKRIDSLQMRAWEGSGYAPPLIEPMLEEAVRKREKELAATLPN